MSDRNDLTRWNRAGLSRFRYVDGNAATYLETLRQALLEEFTDPITHAPRWENLDVPIPPGESEIDRLERLVKQYQAGRQDFGWEIARTLARSTHILTEYLDAYANEGYLDTATQWDNLRRLVEMLDYHPAPPASASTLLDLQAKTGKQGKVETGFQVKNAPEDGSASVIFETLADLDIDAGLNTLHFKDWNRSQEPFHYSLDQGDTYRTVFPLDSAVEGVSQGSNGVLQIADVDGLNPKGIPVTVAQVAVDRLTLVSPAPPDTLSFPVKRYQVSLLLNPDRVQKPRLIGDNTIRLDRDHNLSAGTVIAWQEGSTWYAARVVSAEGRRLALADGESGHRLPPENVDVYRLHSAGKQLVEGANRLTIPLSGDRKSGSDVWTGTLDRVAVGDIDLFEDPGGIDIFDEVKTTDVSTAYYLSRETESSGKVIDRQLQTLEFDGDPGDLASGQWLFLAVGSQPFARQIDTLKTEEDGFTLTLKGDPLTGTLERIFGEFADPILPAGHDQNRTPVTGAILELVPTPLPDPLTKGRQLILENESTALAVTVTAVDAGANTVTVDPPVPWNDDYRFTRHDTAVLGNIVEIGHGESKPQAILGSGDAARSGQTFWFKIKDIAFVADPAQPSGVRAAVDVLVDGRRWEQVATLNDAGPADPRYTVRMTEEGYLKIGFGDGVYGRRLPTGQNNVRIAYRVGTGLTGNVAAGSLAKPVKPHPLVDSVSQPLAASGGNAMEGVESMRENAPASVLTLERAVSLADFTHLAASHSSVWQARATVRPTGFSRHESVRVVVVPAGGGALDGLKAELETFLEANALPGVAVEVVSYEPVLLSLQVLVRIQMDAYDPDPVVAEVRQALLARFSLEQAALGGALYRSAVIQVVEGVVGVENSRCVIREATLRDAAGAPIPVRHVARGADGTIRSIRPLDAQVIYLDEENPSLEVTAEAFSL